MLSAHILTQVYETYSLYDDSERLGRDVYSSSHEHRSLVYHYLARGVTTGENPDHLRWESNSRRHLVVVQDINQCRRNYVTEVTLIKENIYYLTNKS